MEILYGWLVKGRCELSVLDGFIFFVETFLFLMSGVFIYIFIDNKRIKK